MNKSDSPLGGAGFSLPKSPGTGYLFIQSGCECWDVPIIVKGFQLCLHTVRLLIRLGVLDFKEGKYIVCESCFSSSPSSSSEFNDVGGLPVCR